MAWLEIILTIINFAIELWRNRQDPEQAKLRAAAQATKEFNDDKESFDKALAENDATAISAHFKLLHDRVSKATAGRGDSTKRRGS